MKRRQRIFAVVLSGMMAMPFFTGVMASAETQKEQQLNIGRFDSYHGYEAMANSKSLSAPSVSDGVPKAAETAVLPEAYDLRDAGLVTTVKDQGYYGTCWAFAAMGSIESDLIEENPAVDLSEWYLAHYTYSDTFGYPKTVDMDGYELSAFDSGGNYYMLASMLTSWIGPVDEAIFPYDDWSVLENEKTMDELREESQYHVNNAKMLNYWIYDDAFEDQINAVKKAIYDGHVMSVSYFDADDCHNYDTYGYYCDDYSMYYGGWHAVNIVGWDDNYSASNFNVDPGMDGAWLIKNSWGPSWGDEGYFWLSYADESISELFYLEADSVDEHDDMYLHDDYGYWGSLSVGDWGDETAYMANVFTAEEDTAVTAAMFCTAVADENYEITVYTDLTDDTDPTSGTPSAVTTGFTEYMGYQTVDLDEAVNVAAGEKFSVVVRLFSGYEDWHITAELATSVVWKYSDGSVEYQDSILTTAMLEDSIAYGESFYSADGAEWFDMADEAVYEESYELTEEDYGGEFPTDEVYLTSYEAVYLSGNVCVRALTGTEKNLTFAPGKTELAIGDEITLTSLDGSDIYYSFDGETYQLYTEPIVFTEDVTIYAYTEAEQVVYEKTYTQAFASMTTLFCEQQDYYDSSYVSFTGNGAGIFYGEYEAWSDACDYMYVTPVAEGTITYNGEVLTSGETYEIPLVWAEDGYASFTFEVTQDGMLDASYTVLIELIELINYGDANNDGAVDAVDASEVLIYAALVGAGAEPEVDEDYVERADFNWDGIVDSTDASEILIYSAWMGV